MVEQGHHLLLGLLVCHVSGRIELDLVVWKFELATDPSPPILSQVVPPEKEYKAPVYSLPLFIPLLLLPTAPIPSINSMSMVTVHSGEDADLFLSLSRWSQPNLA